MGQLQFDADQARVVLENLEEISERSCGRATEKDLRLISPHVHLLLVEGMLRVVSRQLGIRIRLLLPESYLELERQVAEGVEFATAGEVSSHGVIVRSISVTRGAAARKRARNKGRTPNRTERKVALKLDEWLKKPTIIVSGLRVTNLELIKYVANKLGGKHFDRRRNPNKGLEVKFEKLDEINATVRVAEKKPAYLQFAGLAQLLTNSSDVRKLMKQLRSKLTD
jgi:hypothetical protein